MLLRWAAFIVLGAGIAFVVVYGNPGGPAILDQGAAELSGALLSAPFARALGGAVIAALVWFFFVALWPRRRRVPIYDSLAVSIALCGLLAAGWLASLQQGDTGLSVACVAAGTVLGGAMFARVASVSPGRHSGWLRVPFGLYFGAMTLALLATVAQWIDASGLVSEPYASTHEVATGFLVAAVASGGLVALRYGDFVYPAVITAGLGSMFLTERAFEPDLAAPALIACAGMLLVAGLAAIAMAVRALRAPTGEEPNPHAKRARFSNREQGSLPDAGSTITRF